MTIGWKREDRNIRKSLARHAELMTQFQAEGMSREDASRKAYKAVTTKPDPRDPDYSRSGIFQDHNCYRCKNGEKPCVVGNPRQCEYPHARND